MRRQYWHVCNNELTNGTITIYLGDFFDLIDAASSELSRPRSLSTIITPIEIVRHAIECRVPRCRSRGGSINVAALIPPGCIGSIAGFESIWPSNTRNRRTAEASSVRVNRFALRHCSDLLGDAAENREKASSFECSNRDLNPGHCLERATPT